ncbi:MAG: Bax inhibitor-1/YccA family membrane protein [Pseudomonadales bacterium]
MIRCVTLLSLVVGLLLAEPSLAAEQALKLVTMEPGADGSATYSTSLQILLIMTILSLLPAILMTMTSFTRVIVVLAILRQALGTMQTPSNQILIGLALFTSMFIMSPVFEEAYQEGLGPYMDDEMGFEEAAEKGAPRYMEWYAAFGLLVTLVWLYIEILRLLSKLRSR